MPSQEDDLGKSFLIRVIEWGLKHPQGFGVTDVTDAAELALSAQEKDIIKTYLQTAYKNNRAMAVVGTGPVSSESLFLLLYGYGSDYLNEGNKYVISLDAHFNFIDYQELKFARKNAKEAKLLSVLAILISAVALIIPVIVAVCVTQDVRIDARQLESMKAPDSMKIDDQQANNLLRAISGLKR